MRKIIFNSILFLIALYCLIFYLFNFDKVKSIGLDVLELWLFKVILSIVPMYIFSMILSIYPLVSKFLYKICKFSLIFENEYAVSLFLISFLTGNPTSTILITKSLKNNNISLKQASLILNSCSYISPLFILLMLGYKIGLILLVSSFLSSLILYIIKVTKFDQNKTTIKYPTFSNTINDTIETLPLVLLKILITMWLVALFKEPFNLFDDIVFKYPLDLFEISTGLNSIINYEINILIKIILISFIVSLNGFAIMLQVFNEIKKTRLSFKKYFKSRIIHSLFNIPISLVLYCLIEFIV